MGRIWLQFFLFFSLFSLGQKSYELHFSNEDYKIVKKKVASKFKDSLEAVKYVKELRLTAIKSGFLLASVDSSYFQSGKMTVHFFVGQKFNKVQLEIDPETQKFLKTKGDFTEKIIQNIPFRPKELSQLLENILKTYENNGFPFCKVFLQDISYVGNDLNAKLIVQKENLYRFTKINLVGNPIVSLKLISSYIQIKEGDLFNQQKINEISAKLKLISFINETKPVELLFTEAGVEIFLYLKAKPVSLANGVVGLQPDPIKNKLFLTGELRLKLVNTLKRAELFELNWRNIQQQTSSLKMVANLPNLFQSPFGFDGQFQLYKRDSSFLELKSTLGIQYAMKQGNYLKAFYRRYSSDVLAGGQNNSSFTNLKSVETNFYGLALSRQTVDYLPNPRKGVVFLLEGTIGTRKTKDTLNPKVETTYKGELQIQYYIPLAKRHILKLANNTEYYLAPSYYENEVFRFGGQISLRGFNEEEIKATARIVNTLEYRFLLDQNSFLFAFFDQAWYENKASKFVTDTPFGFGTGLAFGTSIGNFSVSYGIGSQFDNPVNLREGKVHFGYIAYF
ncbi:MAG: POTRA domain-containing protein [Flavobacteriia bacterium]|jgi:outer membrane protein assembly factor BamA